MGKICIFHILFSVKSCAWLYSCRRAERNTCFLNDDFMPLVCQKSKVSYYPNLLFCWFHSSKSLFSEIAQRNFLSVKKIPFSINLPFWQISLLLKPTLHLSLSKIFYRLYTFMQNLINIWTWVYKGIYLVCVYVWHVLKHILASTGHRHFPSTLEWIHSTTDTVCLTPSTRSRTRDGGQFISWTYVPFWIARHSLALVLCTESK